MANLSIYDDYDYATEGIFRPSKANRERVSKMELKEMLSVYIRKKQRNDPGFFEKSGSKLKAAIKESQERYNAEDNDIISYEYASIDGIPFAIAMVDGSPSDVCFMKAGSVSRGKLAKLSVNSLKSITRGAARQLDSEDRAAKRAARAEAKAAKKAAKNSAAEGEPVGEAYGDYEFDDEDIEAMEGLVKWIKTKRANHKAKKAAKKANAEEFEDEVDDVDECVESLNGILLESYMDGDIDFF